MAAGTTTVTDLTKGIYRRIYAGFIKGRRINKLSLQAEAWFWRVMATVDDFGNADADPGLCYAATVGRRVGITLEDVAGWLVELGESGLIQFYANAEGEKYLHIVGFEELQPAGRNGKRVCRFPRPNESGGIQKKPESSCASMSEHSHSDSHKQEQSETQSDSSRDYPFDHFAVIEYEATLKPEPGLAIQQAEVVAVGVIDSPLSRAVWTNVLREWKGDNYKARSAGKVVDKYTTEMALIAAGTRQPPAVLVKPPTAEDKQRRQDELARGWNGNAA